MPSTGASNTRQWALYRHLANELCKLRVYCGSHDLDQIEEALTEVFSHHDKNLGWRVGMRFIGRYWTWFETNTFLSPVLSQAMAGDAQMLEIARRCFMTRQEREAFNRLPSQVRIHRGGGVTTVMNGVCWSLSSGVAARFARIACSPRRHSFQMGQLNPVVVEAITPKSHCFAIKLDRDEMEVIVLPGPHVRVTRRAVC